MKPIHSKSITSLSKHNKDEAEKGFKNDFTLLLTVLYKSQVYILVFVFFQLIKPIRRTFFKKRILKLL